MSEQREYWYRHGDRVQGPYLVPWPHEDDETHSRPAYWEPVVVLPAAEAARLQALEAEVRRMEAEAVYRAGHIVAPEDAEVAALCERIGFGAIMDSAARQWYRRDPKGSFLVGTCGAIARALLEGKHGK